MFSFQNSPPRRWIDDSLGQPVNMISIGNVLAMEAAEDPEDNLALQILADAPAYCYGTNSANGRTHALWALMQLRRDDELLPQLAPLRYACRLWFERHVVPPIPTELLFMFAYASMRLECIEDVKLSLVLAHRRRLSLSQQHDLIELLNSIPDEPTHATPVT